MNITANDILAVTTFKELLAECGCTNIKEGRNQIKCSSPFHKDRHPSFVVFKDTLQWHDYSGDISHGTLNSLVYRKLGCSLEEYLGIDSNVIFKKMLFHKEPKEENKRTPFYYEAVVEGEIHDIDKNTTPEAYVYATRYRHMTIDFIQHYGIKISGNNTKIYIQDDMGNKGYPTVFRNRLLIPIEDMSGRIVSYEGRRITNDESLKKVIYPCTLDGGGGATNWNLFGERYLDTSLPLIVCEGIMDLPVLWRIYKNITCTYGSELKDKHKEHLAKFDTIILMSDGDKGGNRMREHFVKIFRDKLYHAYIPAEKDPGECSVSELEESLKHIKREINGKEYSLNTLLNSSGLF